jgi:hypothetical protein
MAARIRAHIEALEWSLKTGRCEFREIGLADSRRACEDEQSGRLSSSRIGARHNLNIEEPFHKLVDGVVLPMNQADQVLSQRTKPPSQSAETGRFG